MAQTRRSITIARRRSSAIRRNRPGLTWEELEDHIDNDPAFAVVTPDGKNWIDPFTGKRSEVAANMKAAIRHFFKTYAHWQKYPIKSIQELHFWRWVHYLQEWVRKEPRLRFFRQDGNWLNPFIGEWSDGVRRVDNRITSMTLHEMAKVLASSIFDDRPEMKSFDELRKIIEEAPAKRNSTAERVNDFLASRAKVEESTEVHAATADDVEADGADQPEDPEEDGSGSRPGVDQGIQAAVGNRSRSAGSMRAARVQSRLLGELPQIPGYELAVHYQSCDSVGGDFYDVLQLDPDHWLLTVGDVTGHGVQAALTMATVLKALRIIARGKTDPVEIAVALAEDVTPDLLSEQFVTMFFGVLDVRSQSISGVCAGHHPALVVAPEGTLLRQFGGRGAVIGLGRTEHLRATLKPMTIDLKAGDMLVQYTDGVSELHSPAEVEYGDPRFAASLVVRQEENIQDMVDHVVADAVGFSEGQVADDLTVLALRVTD